MKNKDRFENLKVFHEAHKLVLNIYNITRKFPNNEIYGLTSQIRRASVSVVANIIEGNARGHKKEFVQFLYMALGSLEETKYHLMLSKDLKYISAQDYEFLHDQAELVGKLLNGLIKFQKNSLKS